MASIEYTEFLGEMPMRSPRSLPKVAAVKAQDTVLWRGALEPMPSGTYLRMSAQVAPVRTVFNLSDSPRIDFDFTQVTDVVRSPIPDDAYGRTYFSDGVGAIRVTDSTRATSGPAPWPSASLDLGLPAPAVAPAAAIVGAQPSDPAALPDFRYYTQVYVNSYGEEGPPSQPTQQLTVYDPDQSVNITVVGAPTGAWQITGVNLYRSNTSAADSGFQLINATPVTLAGVYSDTLPGTALGRLLASAEWDAPPVGAKNLIVTPAGFLAASYKNQLLFSEVKNPHAWPVRYRVPVPDSDDIVALASVGSSIAVMTDTRLYFASGIDPASVLLSAPAAPQACLSKAGVLALDSIVFYPSPDGLMAVTDGRAELLTSGAYDRDAWQALNPSTITAGLWRGCYMMFYTVGAAQYGAAISLRTKDVISITPPGLSISAVNYNKFTDLTEVVHDATEVLTLGGGPPMSYSYQAAPREFPRPTSVNVLQVRADSFPVTVALMADGAPHSVTVVTDERPVRLPRRPRALKVDVTLSGTAIVHSLVLGETIKDLQ